MAAARRSSWRKLLERIEAALAATAFAEEGESGTARALASGDAVPARAAPAGPRRGRGRRGVGVPFPRPR